MGEIVIGRRGFLKGLAALVAAPAIVRAASLMPIRKIPLVRGVFIYEQQHLEIALSYAITRKAIDDNIYASQFRPSNLGLQAAFAQHREMQGVSALNSKFVYG